jgi:hypothetical protein
MNGYSVAQSQDIVHFWAICDGYNQCEFSSSLRALNLRIRNEAGLQDEASISWHDNLPTEEEFEPLLDQRHVVWLVSTNPDAHKCFLAAEKCFIIFAYCHASEISCANLLKYSKDGVINAIHRLSKHTGIIKAKGKANFPCIGVRNLLTDMYVTEDIYDLFESTQSNPAPSDDDTFNNIGKIELRIDGKDILLRPYRMNRENSQFWLEEVGLSESIVYKYFLAIKGDGSLLTQMYRNKSTPESIDEDFPEVYDMARIKADYEKFCCEYEKNINDYKVLFLGEKARYLQRKYKGEELIERLREENCTQALSTIIEMQSSSKC